ncbi:peptidase U62 modulator of DNA gyrase [Desulfurobacterium thermolithotrophum DSM 11699]|uniref:Peptidase U62 modulator of DNA gyrase n=1 Tax=Desulfurobacterium thermolithotrophum (strain DSM 11699 / BSA) TaxID=868864 RepID=F0S401_DESTD|nr:TldD/PmbA family protein [Desulfurobacterium thermolithotrophum]ADY73573.1 peptidase U62 modulator of DNA gyrase [Desulfurobacterium thermolithotrophum DSM 11699]
MKKLIEKTVGILKKQDIENFDIYAVESSGFTVEVKNKEIERIKVPVKKGLAIRVVVNGKLGFAYTTDVSDEGIRIAIECAKENAKSSSPDDYSFSMPAENFLDFPLYDDRYSEISTEEKINLALDLESKVYSFDPRIKRVRKASYKDSISTIYYYNSNDHSFNYTTSSFSLSILLAAEENEESQMGWDYDVRRYFSDLNVDLVAVRAAENAVELLGAKPLKTKKIPVIFKNTVFAEIIEALSPVFLGNNVLRGKSLFADKLGYEIANHVFNLYDDPTHESGIGTMPFDDEGVATRKKAVVERGVLKNFLLDIYSAKKLGMKSTGNGVRTSISALPQPGITNLVVEKGALGIEELVKTPEEVLLVTDAMGIHTINPISGEFSIGVSGIYFKDGKKVQPVTGMTVAGNIKELLTNITEVGRDQRWIGNICSPSVLIKSLTVSGE